jgi:molybdopterin-containing oxidoreductase family iron-sulfur binding subunit
MKPTQSHTDLDAIRVRLDRKEGPEFWRSLEQLADTGEFQTFMEKEFPQHIEEIKANPVSRRNFLKLMGASIALAGATACTKQPLEKIVPYVQRPEDMVPGKPLFYASAYTQGGVANGILVESHMGRPTKIEGNPEHPGSLGATDIFAQASMLTMYDPDRSQYINRRGRITTYDAFLNELNQALSKQVEKNGAGLRILTETVTSPTLGNQLQQVLAKYPEAQWHQYEPISRDNVREGARIAFGEMVTTRYHLKEANVILSLDSDFLTTGPGGVRYARDFSSRRDAVDNLDQMNRLYVAESSPTLTGAQADHVLGRRAGEIEGLARMIAAGLGISVSTPSGSDEAASAWVSAVVADLRQHSGAGLVIAGDQQPAAVHALAHTMNDILDNTGKTVTYTDSIEVQPTNQTDSMKTLVQDMTDGKVDLLIVINSNPVYSKPADLDFSQAMNSVALRVHHGLYHDETAELCHWHIPQAHSLESWGDVRAYDGTITVVQPLIAPLYNGKSELEFVSALAGNPNKKGYDLVREYWESIGVHGSSPFEAFWQTAVHDGFIVDSALPAKNVQLQDVAAAVGAVPSVGDGMEIIFVADPTIWDGRFANNGWLQELPKPLTKLTWDNAAIVGPSTAQQLDVENMDVVELTYQGRSVQAPVWILPGHPDNAVTVHLGYGRKRAGQNGTGTGFDAYSIRPSDTLWFGSGLQVSKTGDEYPIYSTQDYHDMGLEGLGSMSRDRNLIRVADIEEYRDNSHVIQEMWEAPDPERDLYPNEHIYDGPNAWGMVIDLSKCNGCNTCTIACQAENNISVVGKEEVGNGREMHWIRIDRYYRGDMDAPETFHLPVPCMQCENAPCELVCPVGATVHSKEGLNDMVYNRCVGTRYCSNNCPYKVRRFNFYLYADFETPSLQLGRNPNVTTRSRGVMEKCTYCTQRISAARIEAKKEDRNIEDGEILTACQQACPSQAITFGNIKDRSSQVSKLKSSALNYGLLTDLNTKPRTTYLGRIRNPNPVLEG